ncbi:E3 ubiquitin-protein ligase TRIM32-like [Frankliniella occidentalis]|uniref:E3 ubiquitin-protein ligase TRIM32-like n=1 Tax=Frankliniella occidentalis TaxID=133901 RepID=A0A9C6XA14_FRAOC|nr:E3 ubiquitin-protein ligase TRIM32-like [Frankliniella occidentalis]
MRSSPTMDCNICFEPFDQGGHLPKAMPCGHTVCLACLQRLQNRKCPTCQQAFQVPLSQIPNNYTVLQFLQARPDRTDKSPGWCSRCSAVATPQCRGQQHVVLGVREALEQLLQGALPQASGQLERLKNQCQEDEAVRALALLSGEAWEVTLRGQGPPLSGTLRDTKDPLIKAVLFVLATKGELKAAATLPVL